MEKLLDGKKISEEIINELKVKTTALVKSRNVRPGLAVLLVGDDPASSIYVKSKAKACEKIGFHSIVEKIPEKSSEQEVLEIITKWNMDPHIHGILVQMPLPEHINSTRAILAIDPKKDVDGFHPESVGRLVTGLPGFVPCTPAGIMELLSRYNIQTSGKHAVVVGRSNIVGKPIANLLYQKNKNANSIVTICHSAIDDIGIFTRQADILVAAVGKPYMIKERDVKEGVTIIDVGINRVTDDTREKGYRVVGDVDFDGVKDKSYAITPVPGGVGRMTIAMLMMNTYKAASGEF